MDAQELQTLRETVNKHEREIAENRHGLNNARQVLDVKLDKITGDITDLRNALKWAGGLIISLMISFMAWAALQQYNANETQKRDLQEQLNLLKNSERAQKERSEILDELRRSEPNSTVEQVDPAG